MEGFHLIVIFCVAPIFLSILLGAYWLKYERFPWQKR